MKKEKYFIFFLIAAFILLPIKNAHSISPNSHGFLKMVAESAGQFGGQIVTPKAVEIMAWEAAGFICSVPGTSLSIAPIGSPPGTPSSYFIPTHVTSETGITPMPGQLIIGKHFGTTAVHLPGQTQRHIEGAATRR